MMKPDLSVTLCGIKLKNPVVTASGTSGYGQELAQLYDLKVLGAFTVKSITLEKREGNPNPRIAECVSGILNSIGIPSQGVKHFVERDLPALRKHDVPVIVSIAANYIDDYPRIASILDREEGISAIEVNISCPNLEMGGCSFGADSETAGRIVRLVKAETRLPVIAKLTPNVSDITLIARSVEKNGADALTLINTLAGIAIDIQTMKPKLGNVVGGLSGPAIKPVAVKMVWDSYRTVKIPIIGMGGVMTWQDAIEFILAGATAVGVGTALFRDPWVVFEIIAGIEKYMEARGITRLDEIRGKVKLPQRKP
ncbi:MAG TPA: dihydroorotate dehydrogenase [Thermodesulfobacteriota bacterium]|nr:dihydroorotate dehydrogenase [Thermodesulfobacteriota bacterium]